MDHFIIPDTQCKPGLTYEHLTAAGNYIVENKPEVIIHLGDWFDMPSLSSYEKRGSKYFEGKSYRADVEAGLEGMETFFEPINKFNKRKKKNKEKQYKPRMVFLYGNHDQGRIDRVVKADPRLEGTLGLHDLQVGKFGWEEYNFLEVVNLNKIHYSHYFYNPNTGKPYGGQVSTRLNNIGFSFTQGHQQGKQIGEKHLANGSTIRGLICGSFYQHAEEYRGPQASNEWRGCIHKTNVKDGNYDLTELSMGHLLKDWL